MTLLWVCGRGTKTALGIVTGSYSRGIRTVVGSWWVPRVVGSSPAGGGDVGFTVQVVTIFTHSVKLLEDGSVVYSFTSLVEHLSLVDALVLGEEAERFRRWRPRRQQSLHPRRPFNGPSMDTRRAQTRCHHHHYHHQRPHLLGSRKEWKITS